ncbi:MAG: cell division ATP-binding protein FtsE [Nitrospirae bacterium]|nr:cell division ATP-binding protein FtsE [Nitrospirota bacterium]MBI4837603.1 cell division ATP-binding protein FtsE [Nitrospirota bacterium]
MIQFSDVSKFYDNEAALSDITLTIEKGEHIYITGPSGAGKTTLLKLIYAAERPDKGTVSVAGQDTGKLKQGAVPFLRRTIGVVFQDFRLLPNVTVFDNIALALRIHGIDSKEIKENVNDVLASIGMKHKAHEFPRHLSGGEQQMAAIARAIVSKPNVLLADEPTGNLDPGTADTIIKLFREINLRGTTLIIATHHDALFKNTGHRVIYLKEGKIEKETKD